MLFRVLLISTSPATLRIIKETGAKILTSPTKNHPLKHPDLFRWWWRIKGCTLARFYSITEIWKLIHWIQSSCNLDNDVHKEACTFNNSERTVTWMECSERIRLYNSYLINFITCYLTHSWSFRCRVTHTGSCSLYHPNHFISIIVLLESWIYQYIIVSIIKHLIQ